MNALAKLDKATSMLAEAKTLEEVKHILDIAEAARTYARAAKLGLEVYNHAAEVKVRAERKAGEMLGKLEREHGGNRKSSYQSDNLINEFRNVIEEQNIPQATAYRWQQLAEIPELEFEKHIEESRGERPITTSGFIKPHVAYNSGENEWYTPPEYIALAKAVMGKISLDPASSEIANKTIGADRFYNEEENGLTKRWTGRIWMNPPYESGLIDKFISKYANHAKNGDITEGIVLVNNATETNWFNELIEVSSAVVFPKGRIKFLDTKGNPSGAPLQGQAIVYFGKNPENFLKEFSALGWQSTIHP